MSVNKTDNANNISQASRFEPEKSRPEPSPDEQRRMQHALRDSRRGSEDHADPDGRASSGESILHGLYSASNPAGMGGTLQANPVNDPNTNLAALSEIAEQVLVSSPESSQREIRIQVKSSLIPETDIRLSRHDGVLSVHLVTTSDQSAHFLTMHREGLQQQLENRLGETVLVEVKGEHPSDSGDGRSRQQRDLYAEQRGEDE